MSPSTLSAHLKHARGPSIHLVNPLGSALEHYEGALLDSLRASGSSVSVTSFSEPSTSGKSRGAWVLEYLRALARARRTTADAVLVLWPVLGFWDCILARALAGGRVSIVFHDPVPLVRGVGYGAFARRVARRAGGHGRSIVHSRVALDAIRSTSGSTAVLLPHPMLAPSDDTSAPEQSTVRTLGQYKPDRDLEALEEVATGVGADWRLEILGRGWPEVPGWSVDNRFLPEDEFRQAISSSSVVLIPYRRFFQSGVAMRALELCTPVAGPLDSSLVDFLPTAWLAAGRGAWRAAVVAAAAADPQEVLAIARGMREAGVTAWRDWAEAAQDLRERER